MVEQAAAKRATAPESTKPIEIDLNDFLLRLKEDFTTSLWTSHGNVQDGMVFPDPIVINRLERTVRVASGDAVMVTVNGLDIAVARGVRLGLKPEAYVMFGAAPVNRDPATEKFDPIEDKRHLEAILNAGKRAIDIHTYGRTLVVGYDNAVDCDDPPSLKRVNQVNPEQLATDDGRRMLINLVAEVLGL